LKVPAGTKGFFTGQFKRKASHLKSQVLCRWGGKETICEIDVLSSIPMDRRKPRPLVLDWLSLLENRD
jgi:hypothetical protein